MIAKITKYRIILIFVGRPQTGNYIDTANLKP